MVLFSGNRAAPFDPSARHSARQERNPNIFGAGVGVMVKVTVIVGSGRVGARVFVGVSVNANPPGWPPVAVGCDPTVCAASGRLRLHARLTSVNTTPERAMGLFLRKRSGDLL